MKSPFDSLPCKACTHNPRRFKKARAEEEMMFYCGVCVHGKGVPTPQTVAGLTPIPQSSVSESSHYQVDTGVVLTEFGLTGIPVDPRKTR